MVLRWSDCLVFGSLRPLQGLWCRGRRPGPRDTLYPAPPRRVGAGRDPTEVGATEVLSLPRPGPGTLADSPSSGHKIGSFLVPRRCSSTTPRGPIPSWHQKERRRTPLVTRHPTGLRRDRGSAAVLPESGSPVRQKRGPPLVGDVSLQVPGAPLEQGGAPLQQGRPPLEGRGVAPREGEGEPLRRGSVGAPQEGRAP